MVAISDIQSSNARIASTLPPGLVAVFVGGTSGIGEYTLKRFAKHARQPRIYIVGRSQEAADRIIAECTKSDAEGQYIFIKADTSLIRNVDDVCHEIRSKEQAVNLLFLSTGTLVSNKGICSQCTLLEGDYEPRINRHTETSEGLYLPTSLVYYSRTRFITNLLPLVATAPSLRRIVTVFAGTKEGPITPSDFPCRKVPMLAQRGHLASLLTLSLEHLAEQYPSVSFIHDFPGSVKTNLVRGGEGASIWVLKQVFRVIGPVVNLSAKECGERQLFLATSSKYSSREDAKGVPLVAGSVVARGTDAKGSSGVYSLDSEGESAGPKVQELLAKLRKEGMVERVMDHTNGEFKRITQAERA